MVDQDKEQLSTEELESLLQKDASFQRGDCTAISAPGCVSQSTNGLLTDSGNSSSEWLMGLRMQVERFAARLQVEFHSLLKTDLQVHLSDLEESTYAEFILRMDNPTCLQILRSSELARKGFLELHPAILFPLMDRMLGGGSRPSQIVRRPLTDIELCLVSRITNRVLDVFAGTLNMQRPLRFVSEKIENNPKRQRFAPADDPLVIVQLQIELSQGSGPVRLGIPAVAMQPMEIDNGTVSQLRAEKIPMSPAECCMSTKESEVARQDPDDPVSLSVVVARTTKPFVKIDSIKIGDVLMTEVLKNEPAEVLINGQLHYLASIGNQGGRKAVKILDRVG